MNACTGELPGRGLAREHVLLADEDQEGAAELVDSLTRLGHDVTHVDSGGTLIAALREHGSVNVVLSATLPDIGPEAMCHRLRSFSPRWRIVVVLPRYDELESVLCLEAGADDCVTRPYRSRELAARFHAIARRETERPEVPPGVDCGDLYIDVQRREVRVGEISVDLTRKEFDLLALLVEHRSFVVSRDVIAERVWNGTWSSRTIDTHVASLRSKLARPDLIRTVRGVGFRLSA